MFVPSVYFVCGGSCPNNRCYSKCKGVSPHDASLLALEEMRFAVKHKLPTCLFGFCCSFSASIPNDACCTLLKPPRAPPLHSQVDSLEDEDYEFINHSSSNRRHRYSLKKKKKKIDHPDNVNVLHKYFKSTQPPVSMSPPNVEELF